MDDHLSIETHGDLGIPHGSRLHRCFPDVDDAQHAGHDGGHQRANTSKAAVAPKTCVLGLHMEKKPPYIPQENPRNVKKNCETPVGLEVSSFQTS